MAEKVLKRSEVKENHTWNFKDMYETKEDFEKDVVLLKEMVAKFVEDFDKELGTVYEYRDAIVRMNDIYFKESNINHYGFLPVSVDATLYENKVLAKRVGEISSYVAENLSFFESKLYSMDESYWAKLEELLPDYSGYLRRMKNDAKRALSPDVEKTLKALSPVLGGFDSVYQAVRLCDMEFPSFKVNGCEYPLSFNLYEGKYMFDRDKDVRRTAFYEFSRVLRQYKNTVGEAYYNQVKTEKILATLRGYDSVIDYLLDGQETNRELFDRQLDTIMEKLAPVMRKYARALKKARNLDQIHFCDLKIDFDPEYSYKVSVEEAEKLVEKSISIMGDEYKNTIMRYNKERWIDYPQNLGKEAGGFATMPAGGHPYVMMSWSNNLSSVYTLIHELGHCGQFIYTLNNRKFLESEPSLYIVEAPSTFNELLFTNYLSNKAKEENDLRMERFSISKLLSDTYFHNMVTHLLEAYYQREVYTMIDNGQSFDGDTLSDIKRSVLEKFWGDDVVIDEGAELTWMRQRHYYMGLYSYTYSAGLTVATQAFLKIREGNDEYRQNWLEFLKLGGKYTPVQEAKIAGVDITTDAPLLATIDYLDKMCDRLVELSEN